MSKNIRLTLRCVIFLLIFVAIMVLLSYLFLPKSGSDNYKISDMAAYGIDEEPADSIDVLIVGDSLSYSAFSPMCMWEKQGFTSYVCATSGQFLFDSYDFVANTLKTQKPKVVVLETNAIFRKFNLNNYIAAKVARKVPIIKYHNRWKMINLSDFGGTVANDTEFSYKGYIPNNEVQEAKDTDYMKPSKQAREIPELNQDCIKDILKLCKENNTTLILVSAPSIKNYNYKKHNGIAKFAKKNGITYLDMNLMNDEIHIDWTKNTRDMGDHLNIEGATKVSTYLGEYLNKEFDLPDHRTDANYAQWNEKLNRYKEDISKYE